MVVSNEEATHIHRARRLRAAQVWFPAQHDAADAVERLMHIQDTQWLGLFTESVTVCAERRSWGVHQPGEAWDWTS